MEHFFNKNTPINSVFGINWSIQKIILFQLIYSTLFLTIHFFQTPVPEKFISNQDGLFLNLMICASSTRHPETRSGWLAISCALLTYREMYLRLPNRLLALHLAHKASELFKRTEEKKQV